LKIAHQDRVAQAYHNFEDENGFAKVATLDEIRAKGYSLSIQLHVTGQNGTGLESSDDLGVIVSKWEQSSEDLSQEMGKLIDMLDGFESGETK
jgi:type I restriction enzyme M protein